MQPSLYQVNRQQLLFFGATIFVSITAAVLVSTVIIMSLMRGEIANALTSTVKTTNAPVTQSNQSPQPAQPVVSCTAPAPEEEADTTSSAPESVSAPALPSYSAPAPVGTVTNSFNNTNTNVTTTTNNVTNTEVHNKTTIKDSFNDNSTHIAIKDSFNPVTVKDNEIKVNSDNTTNKVYNTVVSTAINSNNEQHILSDNNTIVAPVPVIPVI